MKVESSNIGVVLISETDKEKELLYNFHEKGIRITVYDISKNLSHKVMIETR